MTPLETTADTEHSAPDSPGRSTVMQRMREASTRMAERDQTWADRNAAPWLYELVKQVHDSIKYPHDQDRKVIEYLVRQHVGDDLDASRPEPEEFTAMVARLRRKTVAMRAFGPSSVDLLTNSNGNAAAALKQTLGPFAGTDFLTQAQRDRLLAITDPFTSNKRLQGQFRRALFPVRSQAAVRVQTLVDRSLGFTSTTSASPIRELIDGPVAAAIRGINVTPKSFADSGLVTHALKDADLRSLIDRATGAQGIRLVDLVSSPSITARFPGEMFALKAPGIASCTRRAADLLQPQLNPSLVAQAQLPRIAGNAAIRSALANSDLAWLRGRRRNSNALNNPAVSATAELLASLNTLSQAAPHVRDTLNASADDLMEARLDLEYEVQSFETDEPRPSSASVHDWHQLPPQLELAPTRDGRPNLLHALGAPSVTEQWDRLVARLTAGDAKAAVTSCRALLEAVTKVIIQSNGLAVPAKPSSGKLVKLAVDSLSSGFLGHPGLEPFVRGFTSAASGLDQLRNSRSDAHGEGLDHTELSLHVAHAAAAMTITIATVLISFHVETSRHP